MGLFFGALSLGHSVSQMPDYGKAIASAKQIFMLIDRKPTIDILNSSGEKYTIPVFSSKVQKNRKSVRRNRV